MKNIFDRAILSYRIHSTFFKVAESIIAVVAGGFIGAAIQEKAVTTPAVLFSLLFGAAQIVKFAVDKSVGESILRELWCSHELELQKRAADRSISNFNRITRSVRSLNEATCSIDQVCDHNLTIFVQPILSAFFDNASELVCTSDGKIHVSVFCEFIESIKDSKLSGEVMLFTFRDDFNNLDTDSDFIREIDSVRDRATSTNQFTIYSTQYTKRVSTIIGAPIPTVCEDGGALGCILISGNFNSGECCHLEEIMSIYSRIIANAISKYNTCVYERYSELSKGQ